MVRKNENRCYINMSPNTNLFLSGMLKDGKVILNLSTSPVFFYFIIYFYANDKINDKINDTKK